MATISTVAVDFIANTAKFTQGLEKAQSDTKRWANNTKKEVDSTGASFNNMSAGVSRLAVAARALGGLAASVAVVGALAKQASDAAGKLSDLAFQVNTNTQNLQRLETTFERSGVSLEEVLSIYSRLEKSAQDAADGNINLLKSFAELGINVDSFNKLPFDKKLEAFARALADIEDPARRASLALDITGKSARKALEGFEEIAKKGSIKDAADDVFVNSERVLTTLDSVGDKFNTLLTVIKRYGIEGAGYVAIGVESTISDFTKAGKAVDEFAKKVERARLTLREKLGSLLQQARDQTGIGPQTVPSNLPVQDIIIPEEKPTAPKPPAPNIQSAIDRIEAQKQINDLFLSSVDPAAKYRIELDKLNKEAEKLKIPAEVLAVRQNALKKEFEESTKRIEDNRRALELNARAEERAIKAKLGFLETAAGGTSPFAPTAILPPVFTPGQQAQLDLAEKRLKDIITFPSSPEAIKAQVDLEKRSKLLEEEYKNIKQVSAAIIENTRTAEESYSIQIGLIEKAATTFDEYGQPLIDAETRTRALQKANEDLWSATNPEIMKAFEFMTSFADQFARAIVEGQNFGDALKNVFKSILKDITVLILRTAILQGIMASIGFINPVAGAAFGQLTGLTPRARGGPVAMGGAYRVGEAGPETFVPAQNGYILPNDMQPGESTNVVQNIYVQTGVAQTVRAEMLQLLPRFKSEAMAGVLDAW